MSKEERKQREWEYAHNQMVRESRRKAIERAARVQYTREHYGQEDPVAHEKAFDELQEHVGADVAAYFDTTGKLPLVKITGYPLPVSLAVSHMQQLYRFLSSFSIGLALAIVIVQGLEMHPLASLFMGSLGAVLAWWVWGSVIQLPRRAQRAELQREYEEYREFARARAEQRSIIEAEQARERRAERLAAHLPDGDLEERTE